MTTSLSPADASVRILSSLLEAHTGQQLSESRLWRIDTELKPIMRQRGFAALDDLVAALISGRDKTLLSATIDALLNHESSFFRDVQVFQMLEQQLLPHLARTRPQQSLRIWCAGCANGQEPYSIAMIIRRQADLWRNWRISIIATDVSEAVIERARAGLYQQIDVQRGLAITDLMRWFEPDDNGWRISSLLRNMIDFRVANLANPGGVGGHCDLILCRNVMLYFPPHVSARTIDNFAAASRIGSYLVLGAGETMMGKSDAFLPCTDFKSCYQFVGEPESRDFGPLRLAS
jgi:chemotaxis protein methyltransferase CheR